MPTRPKLRLSAFEPTLARVQWPLKCGTLPRPSCVLRHAGSGGYFQSFGTYTRRASLVFDKMNNE